MKLLHHLAGLKAAGTNPDSLGFAVHSGVNGLQIYVKAPLGDVMSVTHIIAGRGFLAAYFANLRHRYLQISRQYILFRPIGKYFNR